MKKYCTKCGRQFEATGREVICPSCKAQAAEDARHAAVLRAKRASWNGESVPVRISGRASTVIREYGKVHDVPFAAALDDLLQRVADDMEVAEMWATRSWVAWEDIPPYKSRRMKKSTDAEQDAPQGAQATEKPQEVKVVQAAKKAVKASKTVKKEAKA